MRDVEERRKALSMFYKDGASYRYIAKTMDIPIDTIKSWCRRYRCKLGIPPQSRSDLSKKEVCIGELHSYTPQISSQEERIARQEMEVDLQRDFLILTERR